MELEVRPKVEEAWVGIKEMKIANADTISKKFVSNNGKDMSAQMRVVVVLVVYINARHLTIL